jgi:hypothetical protein
MPHSLRLLYIISCLLCWSSLYAQKSPGQVFDAASLQPVPFVTVKFGETGQGVVASLEGKFEIPAAIASRITWVEVSSLGYDLQRISLPITKPIFLVPSGRALKEVVIKSPVDKIRRILNHAVANKPNNNPDKYDWYQCHVYYKMVADVRFLDSVASDTERKERKDFEENQHIAISETYSIRTWKRPQHLQEDVLATRFSGFKRSVFTSLVTDFLPFHAYSDYINLNGVDYHNPVSRGYESYYRFDLADEILQGIDTVWILSFSPRGNNANELRGSVYINSDGFAISQIIARANDTMLKIATSIEQQYAKVPGPDGVGKWFPRHLNYIVNWQQGTKDRFAIYLKGNSLIDSVTFTEDKNFRFDKSHTVRIVPGADYHSETILQTLRPAALDTKELRTYKVMDSLGEIIKLDKIMTYLSKIPEGKVPMGIFDVDLLRLFNYNDYENVRLGFGAQTNERFIKWLSIGGWGGYGFGDKHWKYGGFAEIYLDKNREFIIRGGYSDDISDPGRILLHRDLDKNYLRSYLLQRVDRIEAWSGSIKNRLGYWNVELGATQQQITPKYKYAFSYNGEDLTSFTAHEGSLRFRYAYAERRTPFFGHYVSTGSNYPIWYGKVTSGQLESGLMKTPYTQAVSAVAYHKHINRLGFEHILVEGGKVWSDGNLPLSKLFAGNGYRYNSDDGLGIYAFGGFPSMFPYDYYTDQFVSVIFRHDIDRKLFKIEKTGSSLSSAPSISLQYGLLYGTLANPQDQKYVTFSVPNNAYHEGGLMINNLVRLRYSNLYYLTLNLGYFYHITPQTFDYNRGRLVFGIGVEL